jgi:hypothetical protein
MCLKNLGEDFCVRLGVYSYLIENEKLLTMGAATTELIRFADLVDRKNREYFDLIMFTKNALRLSIDSTHSHKYNSWQRAIRRYEAFKDFVTSNDTEILTTILFQYRDGTAHELTFEISIDNKVLFVELNQVDGTFTCVADALNFVFETTVERVSEKYHQYLMQKKLEIGAQMKKGKNFFSVNVNAKGNKKKMPAV